MGKSKSQKQAEQNDLAMQKLQLQAQQEALALRRQQAAAVQPFSQQALGIGQAAMRGDISSPAIQALIAPELAGIQSGFQSARQNLVDFFGRSGQGLNSGVIAGPIGSAFTQEAEAKARALQGGVSQGLNLGFQGANTAQGLIGQFNPAQQALPMDPRQFAGGGFLQSLAGSLLSTAGGAFAGPLGAAAGRSAASGLGLG
jgi:hypothetical protein